MSGHSYPLLPVAVLQVVGGAVVPVEPDADKHWWQETIFSHDDKVGEEPTKSLDHTCRHRHSSVMYWLGWSDKVKSYTPITHSQYYIRGVLIDWPLIGVGWYLQKHITFDALQFGKSAFSFSAPDSWNVLQYTLKVGTLPMQFKTMITNQCISMYNYFSWFFLFLSLFLTCVSCNVPSFYLCMLLCNCFWLVCHLISLQIRQPKWTFWGYTKVIKTKFPHKDFWWCW